ncbi:MAG: CDP-alcohol phosphatidyltransferase family protein [Acidimicrobiales bacterium]
MAVPRTTSDRVLTVPNLVTASRLALVPVFVWLVAAGAWLAAASLLALLGATDWVDGFLARRLGQVSTVGKVLDPLADRLLLVVAAASVIAVGAVAPWVAIVALGRELVVTVGFVIVAALGGRRMDVQFAGKAATLAMMFALPLFLAGHSTASSHQVFEDLAWAFVLPGLVLGWYSVLTYVPRAKAAIAGDRRDDA